MKKIISLITVGFMLVTSVALVNATDSDMPIDEEITFKYVYTRSVYAYLSISAKTATCKSIVKGDSDVTKIAITQKLQKKTSGEWKTVVKWSKTFNTYTATFINSKASLSSGTYRTRTVAKVYKGSAYETVSDNSSAVTI